jgi:hypothetical protein
MGEAYGLASREIVRALENGGIALTVEQVVDTGLISYQI